MEVWQTSNLGRLSLGEEKEKDRQQKPQGKNIMSASVTQGTHNEKVILLSNNEYQPFSERELTFTFAMLSPVRLSSVCDAHAPY